MKKIDIDNARNTHIKAIQVIIIVILLISAFYIGKLSMAKQIYVLSSRVNQLETQIDQIKVEYSIKTTNIP